MSAPAPAPLPAPPEEVELAPVDGTVPLPDPVMLRAAICSVGPGLEGCCVGTASVAGGPGLDGGGPGLDGGGAPLDGGGGPGGGGLSPGCLALPRPVV